MKNERGDVAFDVTEIKRIRTNYEPFSSVQLLSRVRLFATPWTAAWQASLSITSSWSPPKLMSIESVTSSNHFILCCPLLLLPSIFPSIRIFSNEPVLCIRWPKYWSFSFSISPSNKYSGLISFRMDWLDLPAVQGTLKSLLQQFSFMPPWKEELNLPCEMCIPISEAPPWKPRTTHFLPMIGNWVLEASIKHLVTSLIYHLINKLCSDSSLIGHPKPRFLFPVKCSQIYCFFI